MSRWARWYVVIGWGLALLCMFLWRSEAKRMTVSRDLWRAYADSLAWQLRFEQMRGDSTGKPYDDWTGPMTLDGKPWPYGRGLGERP